MLPFMRIRNYGVYFSIIYYTVISTAGASKNVDSDVDVNRLVDIYVSLSDISGCDAKLCSVPGKKKIIGTTPATKTGGVATDAGPSHAFVYRLPYECCTSCSCSDDCSRHATCCPDRLQTFPIATDYPYGGVYECVRPQVKNSLKTKFNRAKRTMISRCHLRYDNPDIINKCEYTRFQTQDPVNDIELFVPVTDSRTNETYKNRFCAQCHFIPWNDTVTLPWQIILKCSTEMVPRNFHSLVSDVRESPDCNIVFDPPVGIKICDHCNEDHQLISKCNVTGKWPIYDKLIDVACRAFKADYLGQYMNVFCYVCNMASEKIGWSFDERIPICDLPDKTLGVIDTVPLFSFILDFRPQTSALTKTLQNCTGQTVYDAWKRVCRETFCPDMTEEYGGGCRTIVTSSPSLCHEGFLRLTPAWAPVSKTMGRQLAGQLRHHFLSTVWEQFEGTGSFQLLYRAIENVSLNSENELDIDYSTAYFVIHVSFFDNAFVDTMLDLDNTDITLSVSTGRDSPTVEFNVVLDRLSSSVVLDESGQLTYAVVDSQGHTLTPIGPSTSKSEVIALCLGQVRIVTPLLKCQMLKLNLSDFTTTIDEAGLYIHDIGIDLPPSIFIDDGDGTVMLCVSDYIPEAEKYSSREAQKEKVEPDDVLGVMKLLTFMCTLLSIGSLLLTILTYLLFSELRTQPGINNLLLSVTLLSGQLMFTFAAGQTANHDWCVVIGGVIHFLFQAVMFWTTVCCFHMFRVFRKLNTTTPSRSNVKTTCYYCIAAYGLSLCCVLANVIVSYIQTSDSDLGYGISTTLHSVCYIKSAHMIGYTASLPTALIVGFNVVLFLSVVRRISALPTVQSSTVQHRRYFSVYVKLSTLTGVTWLSVVPYYVTDMKVFLYLCNVLLPLQGVFTFLAFIVNMRVFRLYRDRFCGQEKGATASKTSINEMAQTVSDN